MATAITAIAKTAIETKTRTKFLFSQIVPKPIAITAITTTKVTTAIATISQIKFQFP